MISVTIESEGAVLYMQDIPKRASALVVDAVTREAIRLANVIKTDKLSGQVLRNRTGNLRRSTSAKPTVVSPQGIVGEVSVDKTAPYGAVHEYGGRITIRQHMRTSTLGNQFVVRAHDAIFPERSFMRSALSEQRETIANSIREAVMKAVA